MLRFLIGIVVAALVLVGMLWLLQRRLIYFPSRPVPPLAEVLPGWEEAAFDTSDGLTLHGWFTPPGENRPVVLVFSGNGGNRAVRAPLGAGLAGEGFGVLLFDYRGYGENPGHPSDTGLARDARAALDFVRRRAPGHDLAYFGESLGAAVAIELSMTDPPAALVLRSPFTSLADLAVYHFPLPVRGFLRDEYPSIERIGGLNTAILVIAGDSDTVVPVGQSRELFAAAPEPKELLILPGLDHNDYALAVGPEVIDATARFVGDAVAR